MNPALLRYLPLVLLAVAWEAAARTGLVSSLALPPLTSVGAAWVDLMKDGELITNGASSLWRAGAGLLLAIVLGAALGTTTSHSMRSREAPMLRADQTSACSLDLAPLKAPVVTGSMQPRKISRIFEPLPKPSHSTVTGISADFGIG